MKVTRMLAAIAASVMMVSIAGAQTPAPAPPPAAPAPAAGAMSKQAISKECSAKADAQGLKGKARKTFRSACKRDAMKAGKA